MIVMFIKVGSPPPTMDGKNAQSPIIGTLDDGYASQGAWMKFCLAVAMISVPLMLLVNPCINSKKAVEEEEGAI
jgi:hypothetical protein